MTPSVLATRFDAPRILLHGAGSRARLPAVLAELGVRRPLLITDAGVRALGFVDEIQEIFQDSGFSVQVFQDIQPDPTDQNVTEALTALKHHRADGIIALGGGSPMDTAKVVAVLPNNPGHLSDFAGLHKIARPGLPLIAIPTTAGTGSEATKVAIITDTQRQVKLMMLSAALQPLAAILDYELTLSMPRGLTAAVGVDTLTHGIEAFVSKKANLLTDAIALNCIRLTALYLKAAWTDPQNRVAREGMMLAAYQGGLAFSNSSVCLVHGMARPLGAIFHLPHGLANAVLLPSVTRYSVPAAPARYAAIAKTIGLEGANDESACQSLISWLEHLNCDLELPRLGACRGMDQATFVSNLNKMASDALASGSPGNNPRVPSESDIADLYREAW